MGTGTARVEEKKAADDFMSMLQSNTEQLLGGIDSRTTVADTFDQEIAQMEGNLQKASEIKDERARTARFKILEASADSLRKDVAQEEQDMAQAMVGLRELMAQIGLEYTGLTEPSGAEKALVTAAEARLAKAQSNLAVAKVSFSWGRTGRVATANQEIASAEIALQNAQEESKRLTRARLMSSSLEGSLQNLMTQVGRAVEIMKKRHEATKVQLQKVTQRRKQACSMKEEAATILEPSDIQLNDMEQKLRLAEQELVAMTNGSSEYVAKEAEIAEMKNKVEETRGRRNAALAIFQSKERFVAELGIHATTQRKLLDNQGIWIGTLTSATQERLVTFQSRLEAMKSIADQEVAKGIDQIGNEADGRNAETMARIGATSDRIRMEMLEAHPEDMKRIIAASGAQQESIAGIKQREREAMENHRRMYGISPRATSMFAYEEGEGTGTPAAA
jgi:hypothetical protein